MSKFELTTFQVPSDLWAATDTLKVQSGNAEIVKSGKSRRYRTGQTWISQTYEGPVCTILARRQEEI